MSSQGILEVPTNPLHPSSQDDMRRLLVQMRQSILELRSSLAPINSPTNLRATAQAFSIKVQWTREPNADGYEVLWNSTASLQGAHILDVGNSAEWTDNIGQQNITRFYWVRAYRRSSGTRSAETGPKSATTLASNAGITPPVPPPPSRILIVDQNTGHVIPYSLGVGAPPGRIQT